MLALNPYRPSPLPLIISSSAHQDVLVLVMRETTAIIRTLLMMMNFQREAGVTMGWEVQTPVQVSSTMTVVGVSTHLMRRSRGRWMTTASQSMTTRMSVKQNATMKMSSSRSAKGHPSFWGKPQFPALIKGEKNCDMRNLIAASEWSCPCLDRTGCLSQDRIEILQLYEH
eukprot:2336238-Pleurochrysis_carterae.AAC.2